jgi:hypothetical protein
LSDQEHAALVATAAHFGRYVMNRETRRLPDMRELSPHSRPTVRAALAAVAACVLLAGCGGGDDDNAEPNATSTTTLPTASSTTSPETTSASAEAAVLADYATAKNALDAAQQIPDPNYPALAQHWTGEILKEVQRQLVILQTNGWVIRGTTTRNPKVISIKDTTAVIWDCVHTDGERYNAKTGEVVNPTGPLTLGFEETLVHEGGMWKISARVDQEQACAGS